MNKAYAVVVEANELLVKNRIQTVTVRASGLGMAAHKAWQEIKKRDGVKGKRISKLKLSIVAVDERIEQEENDRSSAATSGV